jgi:hypothetical protein
VDASAVKLSKIFVETRQAIVPIFQRPYVWTEQDNWAPMWRDVSKAAEEVEAEWAAGVTLDKPPTYFMGAVVMQDRPRQPRRVTMTNVIDGQQRLTTLQVLLAAARAVAHKHNVARVEGRLATLMRNPAGVVEPDFPQDVYKVWPLPVDRPGFLWAVREPEEDAGPPPASKLVDARVWFEEQISAWVDAGAAPATRLEALEFALEERVQVVLILLNEGDDPQVIFEALNHLGVPLDAADLVKNLLFQLADTQRALPAREAELTEAWAPLDTRLWRAPQVTGRIRRSRIDVLLSYWLSVQTGQDVVIDRLFHDVKEWVYDRRPGVPTQPRDAAEVIFDIRHYADTYQEMQHLDPDTRMGQLLDSMAVNQSTTPWPLLLWLFAEEVPEDQRELAAVTIDSYLTRRALGGWGGKDYNKLFVQLIADARQDPARAGERMEAALLAQTAASRVWPDDRHFLADLTKPELFNRVRRARMKSLLVGLEHQLRTNRTAGGPAARAGDNKVNIEHLMPQRWAEHWPLPAGADEDRVRRRQDAIHTLGNLTLVTGRLNSALSNRPWRLKRPEVQRHSLFVLTQGSVLTAPPGVEPALAEVWAQDWDEDRIRARTEHLAQVALRRWPRPDVPMRLETTGNVTVI